MTSHRISLAELRFRKMSNVDYVLHTASILKKSKAAIHSFMVRLIVAPVIDYTITGKRARTLTPVQLMIYHINMLLSPRERAKLGIPARVVALKYVDIGQIDIEYKAKVMISCLNKAIDYLNHVDNCKLKRVDEISGNDMIFLRATLNRILAIEKLYRAEFHMRFGIE